MIIGIDASRANAQERTGTEWYSFHVIERLKQLIPAEHTVVLYTKEPLREDLSVLPANWESRVLNWPPRFLWTQLRLSWEMLWHKPDLLYIPAHTIPLVHPKKVALVVHDVGFERQEELYDNKQIGYESGAAKRMINALVRVATLGKYGATEMDYHRFSMQVALKAATKLITISEFSKSEIMDVYGFEENRMNVIYNGLNDLDESTPDIGIFEKHNMQPGDKFILFLGRIEQKKNIPRLVEALAVLRDQYNYTGKLVLAGSQGFGYEQVQEAIEKHNLGEQIVEPGWITNEELAALMQNATAFVLPSLYEGFGIPVLEAMRQSAPVVCSDIPPLREVADEAALFADPRNPEAIAKQLHAFISSEELRQEYIQRGNKQYPQFSWDTTAAGTWKVIEECLKS